MVLPFDPAIPLLGLYPKNHETPIYKNLGTSVFVAALFTTAKIWKQPKCPSVDEWIKNKTKKQNKTVVHLHNRILQRRKKEGIPTFCDSMDGNGDYYAK